MQGQHIYKSQLFFYADIEFYIPKQHILRKIDSMLDLSFVRDITASFYSNTQGRPSIDPEIFFRMYIIGYLYGIHQIDVYVKRLIIT